MASATKRALPSTGGGLKEEISDLKRRRIREEACHLFYRNGYEGTTIDAIAQALDVTKPFIYAYYHNKSEILFDICSVGITLSLQALDQAMKGPKGPAEKLRMMVDRVMRIIFDNQEYIVVYVREEKNLEGDLARGIREKRSLFDHRVATLLKDGHDAGVFDIENGLLTATTIGGMMTWVSLWYSPSGKWSETEILAHVMRMVDAVVRGMPQAARRPERRTRRTQS